MANYSPAAEAALEAACTLADLLDREVSEVEMIAAALEAIAPYLHHDCQQLMAIAKDIEEAYQLM